MRTIRHRSLAPAALQQWTQRGLGVTVTYYAVPAASGAGVNWAAGTAAVTATSGPLPGVWVDGTMEVQGVRGGGVISADAFLVTKGPSAGAPTTRDYLTLGGSRYDVADVVTPTGSGGVYLLALRRVR